MEQDPKPADVALHNMCLRSLKRTLDMFVANKGAPIPDHPESKKRRMMVKIADEFSSVRHMAPPTAQQRGKASALPAAKQGKGKGKEGQDEDEEREEVARQDQVSGMIREIEEGKAGKNKLQIVAVGEGGEGTRAGGGPGGGAASRALVARKPVQFDKPEWHAPWKLMRVISGHMGAVECIDIDPSNEWFVTGAADRTVKIWDLASGQLRLTLTGHINTVRAVVVSPRHPYMFSVGEDKMVKCWDLECNKVIRHYHGHLSGVYCATLHPTLDILITGGRDSVARVWDMRTKAQIHVLAGHNNTVMSLCAQPTDPQIMSGSMDTTVKLWDLAAGKAMCTLTNHKKATRALALHPSEFTFVSGGADNIKKWKLPYGNFLQNLSGHRAIVNTLSINQDGVLMSGGDNGSMHFWDYRSGYNFFSSMTTPQPGSLDSEAGIQCSMFDHSGTRLITGEADKSIKIWKEDEAATPESHPVLWKPSTHVKRY